MTKEGNIGICCNYGKVGRKETQGETNRDDAEQFVTTGRLEGMGKPRETILNSLQLWEGWKAGENQER